MDLPLSTQSGFSSPSGAFTVANVPVPGLGLRSQRKWPSSIVDASGPSPSQEKAQRSTSNSQVHKWASDKAANLQKSADLTPFPNASKLAAAITKSHHFTKR